MISVGYGDISAQNHIECVLATITMLVTGMVYGYSLNCIGNIMQDINKPY